MTPQELIEELEKMPHDAEVLIESGCGVFTPFIGVRTERMDRSSGEYRIADDDSDKYGTITQIILEAL